jgi:hypothetical protein
MNGLGGVLQQVEQHLLQFVGDAGHRPQLRVELADDRLPLESRKPMVKSKVVAGDVQSLVDQRRQIAGRSSADCCAG